MHESKLVLLAAVTLARHLHEAAINDNPLVVPRLPRFGQRMEHFDDVTMKSDLGYESTVSRCIAINMYNRAKANEVVTSKCLCLPLIREWERFYEAC
ncbi:MAG: hypothetical protein IKT02_06520 [Bacteroidales bacterium]|nr:hypothetical protein [Bacteroidales bacterium]